MFKKLAVVTLPLLLIACSGAEVPDVKAATDTMTEKVTQAASMTSKTKAVLVYAEWCGSCKVLDPKIEKVKSMGAIPGVEFVVLDYTDKDADNFYAQAKAAGVETAVRDYLDGKIKTGQLLLVDLDDQTVRGKVGKSMNPAEILGKIKDAVAAS